MRRNLEVLIYVLLAVISATASAVAQKKNVWTSGSPMPVAVQAPMTGVLNGQIYVVGGFNAGGIVSNTQIYNPVTDTWTTGPTLPVPTLGGVAAAVKGILYIFGGYTQLGCCDGVTNAVWAYDPQANTWSPKTAMPTARGSEGRAIENNIVYVIGGNSTTVLRLNTVESYDPATDTWTELAPLLVGKSEPSVGLLRTSSGGTTVNTIVAADGYTASGDTGDSEGYSASSNVWSSLKTDPHPRNEACSVALGSRLFIAGGSDNATLLGTTELYNLSNNTWTSKARMPHATTGPGSAAFNGLMYCFGGGNLDTGGTKYFTYVQIYHP